MQNFESNGNQQKLFYLKELVKALREHLSCSIDNYDEFERTFNRLQVLFFQINNKLSIQGKIEPFETFSEFIDSLTKPLKNHKYFKTLSFGSSSSIYNRAPILTNIGGYRDIYNLFDRELLAENNTMLNILIKCREYQQLHPSDENAQKLYLHIRTTLEKSLLTQEEMYDACDIAKDISNGNILSDDEIDNAFYNDYYGNSFYQEHFTSESTIKVCNLCGKPLRMIKNQWRCVRDGFCSTYLENLPKYRDINVSRVYYEVSDFTYKYITIPGIFETIVEKICRNHFNPINYKISRHPSLEAEGDIKIESLITGRVYLIDCKNYNNILNLEETALQDYKYRAILSRDINRQTTVMFVAPKENIEVNLLSFISNNPESARWGYLYLNDSNFINKIDRIEERSIHD